MPNPQNNLQNGLMEYALALLARRAYSAAGLKKKLLERVRKKFKGAGRAREGLDEIDAVMTRLHELGGLNDLRYAERWVEERSRLKPRGKQLLTQELRHKGISKEVIEQVWEGEIGQAFGEDEVGLAERVAQKKRDQLSGKHEGRELKNRLFRHLASRGFSYGTIGKVVERFLD